MFVNHVGFIAQRISPTHQLQHLYTSCPDKEVALSVWRPENLIKPVDKSNCGQQMQETVACLKAKLQTGMETLGFFFFYFQCFLLSSLVLI